MAIDLKRKIGESPIYHINGRQDIKTNFNFIVTILKTMLTSFLTVISRKLGKQHNKKINNFDGKI